MSKSNPIFEVAPVSIPKVSGHDMSHEHLTSMAFGTLHPTMCMELCPDSTISLGNLTNVSLPPFATQFNGKIDLKTEVFFVPYRLLWGGWKNFISQKNQNDAGGSVPATTPILTLQSLNFPGDNIDRTLVQQLGYSPKAWAGSSEINANPFALLAYHKIWDDWYRDVRLQTSAFNETRRATQADNWCCLPYIKTAESLTLKNNDSNKGKGYLYDGHPVAKYRHRNYGKDYFTTAIPSAVQAGVNKYVAITDNQFSIESLRTANRLQKYAEKLAAVGDRYEDIIAATYGCRPADAVMQKAVLLGSSSKVLYCEGQVNTYETSGSPTQGETKTNPYKDFVGQRGGSVNGTDGGSLIDKFTATEFGVVMVLQSVVPHAYYEGVGVKDVEHTTFTQFGNPAFAGLGNVPISVYELLPYGASASTTSVFGYADRYSEYKFRNDRVTGTMGASQPLANFSLFRNVGTAPSIGSDFIEIPTECMDNVLAYNNQNDYCVKSWVDTAGAIVCELPTWTSCYKDREFQVDSYFKCSVVNPLPQFTIPTLEPPKGETRFVPKGGKRL